MFEHIVRITLYSELNRSIIYRIYIKCAWKAINRTHIGINSYSKRTHTHSIFVSVDLTGSLNENAKHFVIAQPPPSISIAVYFLHVCVCVLWICLLLFWSFTMFFEIMLHIRNSCKHKICMLPKHNKMHYVKWSKIDNSLPKKVDSWTCNTHEIHNNSP